MEIKTLIGLARQEKLSPLQRKVLDYLEAHAGEVFEYRDAVLARSVGGRPSSVGFSLWALHKRGLIEKETVAGKVYFGSGQAMATLRHGLGMGRDEAFEAAVANADQIRARVGDIQSLQLLDELRDER